MQPPQNEYAGHKWMISTRLCDDNSIKLITQFSPYLILSVWCECCLLLCECDVDVTWLVNKIKPQNYLQIYSQSCHIHFVGSIQRTLHEIGMDRKPLNSPSANFVSCLLNSAVCVRTYHGKRQTSTRKCENYTCLLRQPSTFCVY